MRERNRAEVANCSFQPAALVPLARFSLQHEALCSDCIDLTGGYDNVTTNRTDFPLEGGFFRIRQGHEDWAGGYRALSAMNARHD